MLRGMYSFLLRLHPAAFRRKYAREMLWIFDQGPSVALLMDAAVSIFRQWVLRPDYDRAAGFAPASAQPLHEVPVFYLTDNEIPRSGALVNGGILAVGVFTFVLYLAAHGGTRSWLPIGSHHPSPSHLLPVKTNATPTRELATEVKVRPYPDKAPVHPYMRLLPVLNALDTDHDGIISAAEIATAAFVLTELDKHHDGKLSAEECGLVFPTEARAGTPPFDRIRIFYMSGHPVHAALDTDHNAVISSVEIKNAARTLKTLDSNGDGMLTVDELLPPGKASEGDQHP